MEPRKHTLAELFEGQLVYVVPSYQRLYVWNREDQWEPLWSDVEDIANVLLKDAAVRDSESVDPGSVEAHFLGAVVLKMSGSTPDLARQLRVIDGQQRLTTLQLLVAAAVTELERVGLSIPADRLRELTTNSSRSASSANGSYKISHHRHQRGHDYERFRDVMGAALNGAATDDIDGPMAMCYRFFQQAIRGWLTPHDARISAAASALATTLIMKLNLVGIYLDTHEKEHIIFETLNARGEPLTEWDKIKNYLLYKADEEPALSQESFFEDYLDRFDEPWWRRDVGRGIQRPRTDIFADYWLESRKKAPVAVRRVFREFEKHVDNEGQPLESMMQEFIQDARYFERFEEVDPSNTSREALFHNRRLDLAVGAIWPLLLQLQRIDAEQSERNRWFAALESYFVRRMIIGYQARSYDQVAIELLNALQTTNDSVTSAADVITEQLLQYSEATSLWPSDVEVKQAVLGRHLPQYAQRLVQYSEATSLWPSDVEVKQAIKPVYDQVAIELLNALQTTNDSVTSAADVIAEQLLQYSEATFSAIEQRLITNWAGMADLLPNVQIEHIMPRGWQPESWPLPDSVEPTLAIARREQVIETLGNLTLLNGRLNSSISNASWGVKRSAIQESDNLFLNRRLLEESSNEWTEDDITRRGEWMYSIIVDIWPRG